MSAGVSAGGDDVGMMWECEEVVWDSGDRNFVEKCESIWRTGGE